MSSATASIMYLILLSSLLHITTCTVYTVTPDDHYYPNTTCHHCHNLQHYLLNITKHFTSNTQLLFLPGLHHLHTDLSIQNVHNISLIGSKANSTTLDSIIQGNLSSVLVFNVSKLTIKNIIIYITCSQPPTYHQNTPYCAPLTIHGCSFVLLDQVKIYQAAKYTSGLALVANNTMGNSTFSHVECYKSKIQLFYNETLTDREHHSLSIDNCTAEAVRLNMTQASYRVTLSIKNMLVQNKNMIAFTKLLCMWKN